MGMGGEKAPEEGDKDAGDAMEAFFGQFGKMDAYSWIVLEEFFKELMDEEE